MRDAVIVEAVRTPVGRRKGGLAGVHPADLSAHVLRSLVERAGVDPAEVEDVIWGCVGQVGEQTFDIARTAALAAGAVARAAREGPGGLVPGRRRPPAVELGHLHAPRASVPEQVALLAGRLRPIPSGSYRGYTLDLIRPHCGGEETGATVTVAYGKDEVTVPVEDETSVTGRWAEERCAELAIGRIATLERVGIREDQVVVDLTGEQAAGEGTRGVGHELGCGG